MKINSKILSIPPHISTSWDHVSGIFMEHETSMLVISLKSGQKVSIPNLEGKVLTDVFTAHAEYMEQAEPTEKVDAKKPDTESLLTNLKGAFQGGDLTTSPISLDNLGSFTGMMQHDPTQKDAPDLPKEILDRVAQVAKALGLDQEAFDAPEGQPHCKCPYCQIAKTLHGAVSEDSKVPTVIEDEVVADAELKFREWDIKQVADKLYEITNPFDSSEHYQVYLGQPIGCTCGKNNCQHILTVLNS